MEWVKRLFSPGAVPPRGFHFPQSSDNACPAPAVPSPMAGRAPDVAQPPGPETEDREQRRHPAQMPILASEAQAGATAQRDVREALHVSEEINRHLIQTARDFAILRLDPQGRVASWNDGAQLIKGYSAEEIIGRHFRCFYPADDAAAGMPERALAQAAASGRYAGEGWRVRKDGTRFWASVVLAALRDEQGKLLGFSKITRDRTESREAELALRQSRDELEARIAGRTADLSAAVRVLKESQQHLSLAQRAGRICTFVCSLSSGRVTWVGDAAMLFGLAEGTLPATVAEWQRLVHPEDREPLEEAISRAVHTPVQISYRVLRPDRSAHWLFLRAQAHAAEDGRETRILGVNVDITERMRAEDEVRALNAELERRVAERTAQLETANRDLQSFTYSVSHDLRAPLRHIDGFAKILLEDCGPQLDPAARRYLDRIRGATGQMGHLIDDLLNLARVGRREMELRPADLTALVQKTIADLADETAGRNVDWRVAPLPVVACDAGLLGQVFANLLSNALKFTRPRDPAVIEVGRELRGGETVLFVQDNGVGFDPRYADKLFGVFQRLHPQEEFEGTGVGLAIVHRVIRNHGGRIWAEAEPGRGAAFYFTLPGTPAEGSEGTTTGGNA
jgi:PAS domain S-box-containing protein